ncbi:hypothetical protein ACFQUX_18680 [Pantoea stewartii]|uniref:hypothetical protein n=1 Tax=Pantoea stewartii TaxID=66269 RepID=UPI003611644E
MRRGAALLILLLTASVCYAAPGGTVGKVEMAERAVTAEVWTINLAVLGCLATMVSAA